MKYFKTLFAISFLMLAASVPAGCSSSDNPDPEPGPGPGPEEIVVVLKPSATVAKVGETVTLQAYVGDEDVTASARFFNVETDEAVDTQFASAKSDAYLIAAEYENQVSAPVAISFPGGTYEGEGNFFRSALVLQFTATWCKYCPAMTAIMHQIESAMPGRMTLIKVHSSDDYRNNDGGWLVSMFDIPALPAATVDYREKVMTSGADVRGAIEQDLKGDPALCGIAMKAWKVGDQVGVKARIRFAQDGDYKVCCAIIEDGIIHAGGTEPGGLYEDVLRKIEPSYKGQDLGSVKAGDEYPLGFVFTPGTWNVDKCQIVVYVLRATSAGNYVNNAAKCDVGGSVDFAYEE